MTVGLARGRELANRLSGLSVSDAEAVAAGYPDHHVVFLPEGAPATLELRSDRVRAVVRDDVVIDASAG